MYPYIHITLPAYGVMAFVGAFAALLFMFMRLERYKIDFESFIKLFAIAVIGGFVGSKIMFSITQIPWLIHNFTWQNLILLIPQSGYVYYGGLFGVLIALWIFTRKNKDLQQRVFKLIIPAIPLFHFFGRIGCVMAGCCYGVLLENHLHIWFLEFDRMPVQLIEACFELILFVLFFVFERIESDLYSLDNYLLAYAIFRFVIEFYRGDDVRGIWIGGMSTAQYISLIVGVIVAYGKIRQKKKIISKQVI